MADLNLEKYLKLNDELDSKTNDIVAQTSEYLQQNELRLAEDLNPKNKKHLEQVLSDDFDHLEKKIEKSVAKKKFPKTSAVKITKTNENDGQSSSTKDITSSYGGLPETTKNLPPASQNRLLLARLSVLDQELEKQLDKNAKLQANLTIANDRLKDYDLTNSTNQRKISTYAQNETKLKNQVDELKKQLIEVTNSKISNDKELAKIMREDRGRTTKISQQELKLNRAVEEMEKYKTQLAGLKREQKEGSAKDQAKSDQIIAENKRLNRLIEDFKATVKKQFKLIDILKQQKMHLETARHLQFTENEWQKVLDNGVKETNSFC